MKSTIDAEVLFLFIGIFGMGTLGGWTTLISSFPK